MANLIFFLLLKFPFYISILLSVTIFIIILKSFKYFRLLTLSKHCLNEGIKEAIFLKQKVLIDITNEGGLNRVEITSVIQNIGKTLLSKYNHSFRCDFPTLENVEIKTSDKKGNLTKPEIINENPHLKDFYVIFRHSLRCGDTYTYKWSCFNVPKFFDFSNPFCSWEWTPITKVLKIKFEIYHPINFHVTNALIVVKNTGEEIGIAKTKLGKMNKEITEVILKNRPPGAYEIKWTYEK